MTDGCWWSRRAWHCEGEVGKDAGKVGLFLLVKVGFACFQLCVQVPDSGEYAVNF